MPMNRSPCNRLPPHLLIGALNAVNVPPGMTLLQESAPTPPARPTPETLRERGVQPGQTDRNVSLHEQGLRLTNVQVLREAEGDGGAPASVSFRADIAVCDVINLNWRFYPRSAFEAANARAEKAIRQGKLTALLEHPGYEDSWAGRLDAVAARWTALGIEDREIEWPPESGQLVTKPVVYGEGIFIGTPSGELVKQLLSGGVFVGISTNGYSSVQWRPFGELGVDDPTGLLDPEMEIPVTGDDFTYLTIDFVSMPANAGGQTYSEHAAFAPLPTRQESAPPPVTPPAPRPAPSPGKETYMHPKIKALLERLGKTLEQVKAENQTEYQAALEAIADEQHAHQEAAALVPGLQAENARLLTENQVAQTALSASEAQRSADTRARIVDDALAAANLPTLDPYQEGDIQVDLNAAFRESLLNAALAADSDDAARASVARQVARQQHLLGTRPASEQANPPPAPARSGGPSLPVNDMDAVPALESLDTTGLSTNPLIQSLRS